MVTVFLGRGLLATRKNRIKHEVRKGGSDAGRHMVGAKMKDGDSRTD